MNILICRANVKDFLRFLFVLSPCFKMTDAGLQDLKHDAAYASEL
jgi:hypothetical protein